MQAQIMKVLTTISVVLVVLSSSFAATFHVGACHTPSYPTISAAVAAVPAGSVIDVCPGTYAEQVFITDSLTVQGINSSNDDRARIVVPPGNAGVPAWTFVPDPDGGTAMVAPQIYVNAPSGTVKITNLTIDASGETGAPACLVSGYWRTTAILYENTNGTIKEVNTVGQGKNSGCGDGIRAFAPSTPATLTLTDSSLQDTNESGVILEGADLTVTVSKNVLALSSTSFGISSTDVSGTISSNFVQALGDLIFDSGTGGPITISDNVLNGLVVGTESCSNALTLSRPADVTGNRLMGCGFAIAIAPAPAAAISLKTNSIANTGTGIDLGCDANVTLSNNTINNAPMGVVDVPASFSLAGITFDNVDMPTPPSPTCPL